MKKKILLALVMVIVLLGVGVGYAYFATDAFKSEKEMFFSYILEDDMLEGLEDEKVTEYVQKQLTTPFTNKGEISLNVTGDEVLEDETVAMLNNSKIEVEGKVDASKDLTEQTLTVDLGQGFNIPVNLKLDGKTIGVQSELLYSKYIAVRNENLKALFKKFGMEAEEIPDEIEFSQEQFTEEELKTLSDKYMAILNDNLEEELFSKEKQGKQTIVTLKMSEQKFIDVVVKILETARNDELLLSKMSGIYEKEELQTEIDDMITELKETETSETNTVEIKLYVENKDVKKYEINVIEDEETVGNIVLENTETQLDMKMYEEGELVLQFNISKEMNENDPTYTMSMKVYDKIDGDMEARFKVRYKNVSVLDNVEENYEVKMLTQGVDMTINLNNVTTFEPELTIEGLNEDNAVVLNDATEQELQNLVLSIYQNLGLM